MAKSPPQQQYDDAVANYRTLIANPPKDYDYCGNDTMQWLKLCDAKLRVLRHLKAALKLKEPRNGTSTARRK